MKKKEEKKEEQYQVNLLQLTPVRNIKWEKQENGLIVLLKPKFKNTLLVKYVLPRLKKPYYKVKLDEVGSYVWELCDGRKTVKELAYKLQQKFGEKVEPLYDRLSLFLQSLEKNKFIRYKNLE